MQSDCGTALKCFSSRVTSRNEISTRTLAWSVISSALSAIRAVIAVQGRAWCTWTQGVHSGTRLLCSQGTGNTWWRPAVRYWYAREPTGLVVKGQQEIVIRHNFCDELRIKRNKLGLVHEAEA